MNGGQQSSSSGCFGSLTNFIGKALAIGLGVILLVLVLEVVLWAMGGLLIVADPLEPAEAIVALSGGGDRINEAARLYQNKSGRVVILTETGEYLPEWNVNYSTLLIAEAVRLGIPSGALVLTEGEATSTWQEAQRVRDLMTSRNIQSAIVVTDPFHTFRTRLIFREVFQDSGITISIQPVQGHWYQSRSWWATPQGRRATVQEYVKLIAYMLGFKTG